MMASDPTQETPSPSPNDPIPQKSTSLFGGWSGITDWVKHQVLDTL